MIEAWLSSSEMTASSPPRLFSNTPPLASQAKPGSGGKNRSGQRDEPATNRSRRNPFATVGEAARYPRGGTESQKRIRENRHRERKFLPTLWIDSAFGKGQPGTQFTERRDRGHLGPCRFFFGS